MNAETQKVDVLAVMDRARDVLAETYAKYQTKIGPFASQSQQSNVELRIAHDAVAELIEADKSYDKAREAHGKTYHSGGMVARRETHRQLEAAKKRRAAALARVGGAK